MKFTFVGCGDAFGSGGRFQTCFHVETSDQQFLIDFGATSMVAVRQRGLDLDNVSTIFVSHLHGDHFGGLPFFLLDAQLISRRTAPITLAGPVGLQDRLMTTADALFPGSASIDRKFDISWVELSPGVRTDIDGKSVTPIETLHPSGAPSLALRIETDGRTLAYSGDTGRLDGLETVARDADLFVCESSTYDKVTRYHLDYNSIVEHADSFGAKRLILTHMGPEMLDALDHCVIETAHDGLVVDF